MLADSEGYALHNPNALVSSSFDLLIFCWRFVVDVADVEGVRGLNNGFWNSIHVVEATQLNEKKFEYKLTTTVIVRFHSFSQTSSSGFLI